MPVVILCCVILLALIGHGYLWIGPVNRLHAWAGPRFLIDAGTLIGLFLFVSLPLLVVRDWWQTSGPPLDFVWSGTTFSARYLQLCAVWGAGKIVLDWLERRKVNSPKHLLAWKQERVNLGDQDRSALVQGTIPQLLMRIPGNQSLQLMLDHKRLAIPQLPSRLEGLRIAHLSDLHMTGRISRPWFECLVEEVNQLECDVIAITGDILENEACWDWLACTLGRLRAKFGGYFILGNHDYFVDVQRTRELLIDQGLVCLSGRWAEAKWNDTPILLAGNERPWGTDELDQQAPLWHDTQQKRLRCYLIHTPDQFAWAHRHRGDLVLAGHTHGGQIRFPILGPVACPSVHGTRYACGVFQTGDSLLHVSRGISGETPIRWNCPPEIAVLELTREQA